MKSRGIVFAVTASFLLLAAWIAWKPGPPKDVPSGRAAPAITQTGEVIPSATEPAQAPDSPDLPSSSGAAAGQRLPPTIPSNAVAPLTTPRANAAGTAAAARESAMVEVGKVHRMIVDYHTLMGENPVGTNAEIMRALMGGNPHEATLGPPEGQTLNDKGELIDQWGTPYFSTN